MTDPSPVALPDYAWRVLHSAFVDEVCKASPDVSTKVIDRVGGVDSASFADALKRGALRPRVVAMTRDDVWVFVDYSHEGSRYSPAFACRARRLGLDSEELLAAQAVKVGMTIEEMLGEGDQ